MRILHVIHSANPAGGGVIEAINQLSRVHRRQGHTVEIVSLDAPKSSWLAETQAPVHALGPGLSSYGYAPKLTSWLRENRRSYDAVVVNGLWQYVGYAVRQALYGTSTPYLVFPHGMLDPWFKQAYPLKHLKKTIYWQLAEFRVLRDARRVIFTSDEEQRLARESFRPYRCREAIANLGTTAPTGDPERQRELFHATFPGLREQRLLLFLGRLHAKKGCDLLIKAFARVRREAGSKGEDLHLVLAGPCADPAYLGSLKELALSEFPEQPSSITWTGMITGDLKWGAYRAADMFILPSHQENFGFSVVEALAAGVPVCISNKVNIWREIEQDQAGIVANDDLDGTVLLLRRWLELADDSRRAMRAKAVQCFKRRFEVEQAATNLIDLLSTVLPTPLHPSPVLSPAG